MKRRSFLKTVSAASLGVGVTPAWSVPHLADREMVGISISVAVVPGGDLVIKDAMIGAVVRLRLCRSDYSGQQHDRHRYCFHKRLLAQECGKVYTLVHLCV